MISSFPLSPRLNMAGLASFKFSPHQNILDLPAINNSRVNSAVQFRNGYSFLNGISSQGMLDFEENSVTDSNGTIYPWLITGFYPGDSPEVVDLFRSMEQERHLVLMKDFSGALRLIGHGAPLIFNSKFNSGKLPGEARGYSFTFTGTSLTRAPYYQV